MKTFVVRLSGFTSKVQADHYAEQAERKDELLGVVEALVIEHDDAPLESDLPPEPKPTPKPPAV